MAYSDEVLADSPVAYWRLGESSGTTAVDEIGANDGTYVNSPTLGVPGLIADDDTAVNFDDANSEYVTMGDITVLDGQDTWTVECWVSWDDVDEQNAVVAKWNENGVARPFLLDQFGGEARALFGTGGDNESIISHAITTDTTYHLVMVADGSTARFYVDAVEVGNVAHTQTFTDNAEPFLIGAKSDDGVISTYLDGTVDEVAVYDYALSATRIQAHYDAAQETADVITFNPHTVLLKHRPLIEGIFSPHTVVLNHFKAVPLQPHIVSLAHLANAFRGDNSEEGQAQALQAKLGYGWGVPDPSGSANEKMETPRETWPIDRFHEAERLMLQEGVDEKTARGVGEAMRRLGEDIQLDVRENLQKAQWHANVHTHGSASSGPLATLDVWGLVKLPNGNFWATVGNSGDKVREFDSDWNLTGKEFRNPAVGSLDRSRGITFDGRYLWLTGDSPNFYQVDHLDGGKEVFEITPDQSDLEGDEALTGITFDGVDLWVANVNHHLIWQFATDGTEKQELVFSDVYSIQGLAYWNGHLYFVDFDSVQIVKMTPNGNLVDFYDVSDVTTSPTGIWISDTGKALISEDGVGVWEFDLSG